MTPLVGSGEQSSAPHPPQLFGEGKAASSSCSGWEGGTLCCLAISLSQVGGSPPALASPQLGGGVGGVVPPASWIFLPECQGRGAINW